jgi:diacylglycerol kinase
MAGRARPDWRAKFAEALRGLGSGLRREANFRVHAAVTLVVVIAGVFLGCERIEWALLALSVGLVFTAELLNTALERLFHGLDEAARARISGCLDVAAGAVLAAALTAAVVGGIVFVPRLAALVR